jgi:cholesterol transport system auxiliary component
MRCLAILALAVSLAGCAALGDRPADRYYVLQPVAGSRETPCGAVTTPMTAASFYDTQDIVFSRSAGTRGYYQFNHWTERPQRVISAELAARCAPRPDGYILATHLVEIYHDAVQAPGTSRVTVTAELIEPARRSVVARRTFSRAAPARSYDAAGAVAAFDDASGRLVDDIVEWTSAKAAARSAR